MLIFMGVTTTKYEKDEEQQDTWVGICDLTNNNSVSHKPNTHAQTHYSQKSAQ